MMRILVKNNDFHIKKITLIIFSLVLVLIAHRVTEANSSPNNKQLTEMVGKAKDLIDEYNGQGNTLYEANELLTKATEVDSTFAPIYIEKARLTLYDGHIVSYEFTGGTLEKAESLLKKAVELDARDSRAYVIFGHVNRLMGKYDEAFQSLTKATELKSKDPWLLNNFGAYYESLKQIDKAKEYYLRVVKMGSGKNAQQRSAYIDAALKLQWFAALKDDNKSVFKYAELATKAAKPTDAWTWGNAGGVLLVQGYFDETENYERKALSIMNFGVARETLSFALYGKWAKAVSEGHPDKGESFFQEAYKLNPDLDSVISRFSSSVAIMKNYVPILLDRKFKLISSNSGS
ncbi:MAG: hypothetical protein IPN42_09510 [Methylococcaceae bacterium]|nr:hypothetical protein [Methylococcaceae bacterium]